MYINVRLETDRRLTNAEQVVILEHVRTKLTDVKTIFPDVKEMVISKEVTDEDIVEATNPLNK